MTSFLGSIETKIDFSLQSLLNPPLSDREFRSFLDNVGELVRPRELRIVIYKGGVEPALRKVVWKHLLGVYPNGLDGRQRLEYMRHKSYEYDKLKNSWMEIVTSGQVTDEIKMVTNMIRKDVLRTDRMHKFYSGDANENITTLYNILTTYALTHPSIGYCQVIYTIQFLMLKSRFHFVYVQL